jgi:hypothetical protein
MNKRHLYLLSGFLTAVGLALFLYKILVLDFPLIPGARSYVWHIEAHLTFEAGDTPIKVALHIPRNSKNFAIVNENFVSRGYGVDVSTEEGKRKVIWSIRKAKGLQSLFYEASVLRVDRDIRLTKPAGAELINRTWTVSMARHPRPLYQRFVKNRQIRTAWWRDY